MIPSLTQPYVALLFAILLAAGVCAVLGVRGAQGLLTFLLLMMALDWFLSAIMGQSP